MKTTNTFVQIAADCPATIGEIPKPRGGSPTVPSIQYELLTNHPYRFTEDELIFEVFIRHKGIPVGGKNRRRELVWKELFAKSHPCMRASMLPKRYGWGVHYDEKGKIALVAAGSKEYAQFLAEKPGGPTLVFAMRNKRA